MKVSEVLNLDCRIESNRQEVQRTLRKIKPFAKWSGNMIPMEMLERCLQVLSNKYDIHCRDIYPDTNSGNKYIIWRSIVIDGKTLETVGTVYGCTFYEVLAKTVILVYAKTRNRE